MTPFASNVADKRFAFLISTMIDSRLIWYKHYYLWADDLIASLPSVPQWVLQIATIKYYPDAVAEINRFVHSEPFEQLGNTDDERVACLFLQHRMGALSWATFLDAAGRFIDASGGGHIDCEFFFCMLNDIEDANYGSELESQQVQRVYAEFASEIESVGAIFSVFHDYFRRYVSANSDA
ncbi:hypothetical protein FHS27_006393 [Rhodopirellula rubra]|uniref:Uncharacterized protein n=1 Tax=Aporhodopirellula rubra TaxID=980271 RepID=A0A7W5H9W8_9BACT|nr:hypothetical protein [Aporhodopirellula rubra]MBB3210546.1 hypothetical protein [Aporhodopirellula rubra]